MELSIDKAEFAKTSLEQISEALKKGLVQNPPSTLRMFLNCSVIPGINVSGNVSLLVVFLFLHFIIKRHEDIKSQSPIRRPKTSNITRFTTTHVNM